MYGEEHLEVDWYIHRGHKFLNKMKCHKLGQEIKQFDDNAGGHHWRLAQSQKLLTLAARHRILSPEQAIESKVQPEPQTGFRDIEQFAAELSDDYGVSSF